MRTEQVQKDYTEHGDLGLAAFHARSNQRTMFPMPSLTVAAVFSFVAPEPLQPDVRPLQSLDMTHVTFSPVWRTVQSSEHATGASQRDTIACTLVIEERAVLSREKPLCTRALPQQSQTKQGRATVNPMCYRCRRRTFREIAKVEGHKAQDRKIKLITKLLVASKGMEPGYIMRALQVISK